MFSPTYNKTNIIKNIKKGNIIVVKYSHVKSTSKLLFTIFLLILTIIFETNTAQADTALYLSGNIGSTDFSKLVATDAGGGQSNVQLNNSLVLAGAIGARVNEYIRTELELSHRNNSVDSFNFSGTAIPGVAGRVKTASVLANAYFDFLPDHRIRPYVSGGLGIAHVKSNIIGPSAIFTNGVVSDDNETVFAWQVGAGLSLSLNDKLSLTGGYRFFHVDTLNLDTAVVDGPDAHEVVIGIRYEF